ncbi:hypothetical protein ACJX0J_036608 [Zea mays]
MQSAFALTGESSSFSSMDITTEGSIAVGEYTTEAEKHSHIIMLGKLEAQLDLMPRRKAYEMDEIIKRTSNKLPHFLTDLFRDYFIISKLIIRNCPIVFLRKENMLNGTTSFEDGALNENFIYVAIYKCLEFDNKL